MPSKPVRGGDPGRGGGGGGEAGRPGPRRGEARGWGGPGRAGDRKGSGERGGPAERPGCAGSLRAALAHGPLRNRQRRGFPRGGSLSSTITHSRAPPRLTKWRRPWIRRAAAPPAPFCARREICQHGIPPPRMHPTGKPAQGSGDRGDRPRCATSPTARHPPALRPLPSSPSEASEAARHGKGS